MQLTQDEEQVLAILGFRILRQGSQGLDSFLLIEMDVQKREAHVEREEWCCE